MIGIADQNGTWVWVFCRNGMALLFLFIFYLKFNGRIFTHSMPRLSAYFFVLRPVTLPQPGLGRIAEQVQVLVA